MCYSAKANPAETAHISRHWLDRSLTGSISTKMGFPVWQQPRLGFAFAMEQARNVLILKGNVPAEKILDLLDALLEKIKKRNGCQHPPHPWQLFSFVGGSGASRNASH